EPLSYGFDEVVTGRAGHADVADQEIEARVFARKRLERLGGGRDAHDVGALLGEQALQVFARVRLVVDRANAQPGEWFVAGPLGLRRQLGQGVLGLQARQTHAEHRALAAAFAVHGDRAAV